MHDDSVIPLLRRLIILAVAVQGTSRTHAAALSERHGVQCSETCSQYSSPNFLSPYLMRGWNGFGTESQKLFFAGVIRRATQAFAGLRGWHRPRERALARGVNKKHFSGTAEAGALPKNSRAFVGRSARPGRVRDPSLHNHQRPVPTQPLETVPTRASSRAR